MIISSHVNRWTHPIDLIYVPQKQFKVGNTIYKYFHRYKYYLELIAYLNNDYDPDEFYTFILVYNHWFEFRRRSHEELHSKDNKKRHKFYQGKILTTLITFKYDILK